MMRKGQRFLLNGEHYKVAYVNASRAHCVSVSTKTVTIRDAKTGAERKFSAHIGHAIDISPDTDVEVLRALAGQAVRS